MATIRGILNSVASLFRRKEPTRQQQLDAYYRANHTYKGFKLAKDEVIVNGCICKKGQGGSAPVSTSQTASTKVERSASYKASPNSAFTAYAQDREISAKKGDNYDQHLMGQLSNRNYF